ncbi:hypothetical protein FPF71_07670 [Algibacter amylolyticus]|uniref:Uncharacterized protein n=1 Tax=Algibacter amylolyticus TaxID=1608400 RepID=A0A5M7B648_9FLAO|nr:hypothetical protein F2B50_07670 [Algibacter amylolyticus]TSJ77560.1 hypothetical protein FPF71_07670 [Algibacter amylolyticus]
MLGNVYVYEMLRVCVRGFSEGKSEANKRATNFGLGKTSNFLYTLLWLVFYISLNPIRLKNPTNVNTVSKMFNFRSSFGENQAATINSCFVKTKLIILNNVKMITSPINVLS